MINGLGIDLVQISRFENLIIKWQEKITNKLFTEEEYLYCSKHKYSYRHFASTFAVKEALIKAHGKGNLKLKEIEVIREETGKPAIRLHGSAKIKVESAGIDFIHVTITHDADYSVAVVILENKI